MLVNTYDVFGDYYVITVASLAEGQWRGRGIEIPDNRFLEVMQLASSLARGREEEIMERRGKSKEATGVPRILPMTGNDKKPFERALSCLNIPPRSMISEILRKVNPDMAKRDCPKVTAPSFVKPDMYEHGRYPGYKGNTEVEVEVDPVYLVVAVAGWVLSRLGETMMNKGERIGVHLFPVNVDRQFTVLPSLVRDMPKIPGFFPSTAFLLWLTYQMVKSKAVISSGLNIYAVSDAAGQSPAAVVSGYTTSVERLLDYKIFKDRRAFALEAVTAEALKYDSKERRNLAIRISNLLYEVLMGSRRSEELMYIVNREILSIKLKIAKTKTMPKMSKENKRFYEMVSILANMITEALEHDDLGCHLH